MHKKIFGLFSVLILSISLTACGTSNGIKDNETNNEIVESQTKKIDITKDFNFNDYNLVNSVDFDFDGNDDSVIELYTTAVKNNNGEFMMDDGQDWLLVAKTNDGSYLLFQDYIQIGSIDFNAFTIDDDYFIVTKSASTANLNIEEYKYDKEGKIFIQTEKYSTQGNVNMIY